MKNSLVNLLLALTSVALILGLLEVVLYLSGYSSSVPNVSRLGRDLAINPLPGVRYLYNGHASYRQSWPDDPRGYLGTDDHSMAYRVNNYGFRGDDFDVSRNERLRIAVVGDSICWGTGVREADRFSTLIEEELDREEILGQRYEVYNFCLPGFNTQSEVALYEQVIQHFRPDLLLVSFFLNDVNLRQGRFGGPRDWEPASLEKWRERFRTVDWVASRIGRRLTRAAYVTAVESAFARDHRGYRSVVDGFERLAQLNRPRGIPTLLIIFPWLAEVDRDYPFHAAHRAVSEAGREAGLDVLDLFPSFAGRNAEELWIHPLDRHPNEVAHRIAADAIFAVLVEILTGAGDDLLAAAVRRGEAPIPAELRAPPAKEWYEAFAAMPTRP